MGPWELRERRRAGGLRLREVARAAGTSVPNLSAYERGTKRPNETTLERLLAVLGTGADSAIHSQQLQTVPATAAALRAGLRQGWSTADLLRTVRQLRSDAGQVRGDADHAAFFAAPTTIGDPRWDALLAGVVEDLALTAAEQPPAWTGGHALPEFWFVSDLPSLRAYAFARTPMSLQVRGVLLDPDDLVAV